MMNVQHACWHKSRIAGLVFLILLAPGCAEQQSTEQTGGAQEDQIMKAAGKDNIIANNAFFYYRDIEAAAHFYTDILGLRIVADYGFAKILRVARTSYLTLVDAESGMHSADEPKTVAIALITDELDEWYRYLSDEKVTMRSKYNPVEGRPHHGFVVYDPEGYYLEFERFNPHPENERLIPMLADLESLYPDPDASSRCPKDLGFKATVLWLYYRDMASIQRFWEDVMGFELVVDQGWAKIYPSSATGFIGPVDGERGMHSWTEDKCVTVSFFTEDVDGWFAYLKGKEEFRLRTPEVQLEERAGARVFVGYDPEGYFLEFDTFLENEDNRELFELLKSASGMVK
jgi:catechol 2,3-dioxygenase-like lactoylglutathione lyase family enzyme